METRWVVHTFTHTGGNKGSGRSQGSRRQRQRSSVEKVGGLVSKCQERAIPYKRTHGGYFREKLHQTSWVWFQHSLGCEVATEGETETCHIDVQQHSAACASVTAAR